MTKNEKAFNLVKSLYKNKEGKPFEMTEGQIQLFRAIYEKQFNRLQVECYTGFGKLIADDTPVLTSNGWKKHGELVVGDYVFNHLGKKVKIIAFSEKGIADYKITFSNGEEIICNERHEWLVSNQQMRRKKKGYRVLELRDILKYKIKIATYYNFFVPNIHPLLFEKKKLPVEPYTFGAWLGDGTTTKTAISGIDNEIIKRIPYKITKVYKDKNCVNRWEFNGGEFSRGLKKMGFVIGGGIVKKDGTKSWKEKFIPDIYKQSSIEQRLDLLAGLLDTDGYIGHDKKWKGGIKCHFVNTNKKLIDDVAEIIFSLGMRASIHKQEACLSSSGIQGKKDVYTLSFVPSLKIPTVLKRKKIELKPLKHITIRKIEKIKPQIGKCIHIGSKDGIYLVGKKLIPTHNSEVISMAVLTRASTFPEAWSIVGGTKEKARIIMGYIIKHLFENEYTRSKFEIGPGESSERIRRERSKDRLTFRMKKETDQIGEIRILSGEAKRTGDDAGDILVGLHSKFVVEDDAPLIPDLIHGKMMRMLDNTEGTMLVKIGNTIRRNHFYRSHTDPRYHKIIVDYKQGLKERRTTKEYIDEMRKEFDPLNFSMFYECKFPPEETVMDGGWMKFLMDRDIDRAIIKTAPYMVGEVRLGIDVAGAGRNYSEIVMKCDTFAQIIYKSQTIDPIDLGVKAIELRDKIRKTTNAKVNCYVDAMGVGMKTYGRMKETIPNYVFGILGGDPATNRQAFYNKRAEMYWNMRESVLHGLKLVEHQDWGQLRHLLYKIELDRRVKMMSKEEMRKRGIQSPDAADALSLCYALPPTPMVDELYPQLSIKKDEDFEIY